MKRTMLALFIPIFLILSACATTKPAPEGSLVVQGIISRVNLEGGCWILQAGEGTDLKATKGFFQLIIGDDFEKIRRDKARVTLRILPHPDMTTTCQMGIPAEVLEIINVQQ